METLLGSWLGTQLDTFLLGLIRVGSWIAFMPFFGNDATPARFKAGLAIALAAALLPVMQAPAGPLTPGGWVLIILSESAFGLLMGLTLQIVFDGVQFAGHIFGIQLGHSLASVIDPHTQVETPVISVLYQTIAMLIFLALNAHHWIIRGLARSFELLPPGAMSIDGDMVRKLVALAGNLWVIGIEMAAPILMVTLLADLALGFLGKQSPQLPVMLEGISVKTVLGFTLLISAMVSWPHLIEGYLLAAFQSLEEIMRAVRP
jgi:flagellar biosynthetic protein FliR